MQWSRYTSLFLLCLVSSGCAISPQVEWRTAKASQARLMTNAYQQEANCQALFEFERRHCCDQRAIEFGNQELVTLCNTDNTPLGVREILSLNPQPSKGSSPEELSYTTLPSFRFLTIVASLAEAIELNYLIDASADPEIRGTFVNIGWGAAFAQVIRAANFDYRVGCQGVSIGRQDTIQALKYSVAEFQGNTLIPLDCDKYHVGTRLNFHFDRTPIDRVIAQIAVVSNINFILDASVHGLVSGRLDQVTWDEVLELLLSSFGLDTDALGNFVRIGLSSKLRLERKRQGWIHCSCEMPNTRGTDGTKDSRAFE